MSNISLSGRLTADPGEPRTTPRGAKVLDVRLAVEHPGLREPVFVDVMFGGAAAAHATSFLRKGSLVAVSGELVEQAETDPGTGQVSSKRFVNADSVAFLDRVPAQAPPSPGRPATEDL